MDAMTAFTIHVHEMAVDTFGWGEMSARIPLLAYVTQDDDGEIDLTLMHLPAAVWMGRRCSDVIESIVDVAVVGCQHEDCGGHNGYGFAGIMFTCELPYVPGIDHDELHEYLEEHGTFDGHPLAVGFRSTVFVTPAGRIVRVDQGQDRPFSVSDEAEDDDDGFTQAMIAFSRRTAQAMGNPLDTLPDEQEGTRRVLVAGRRRRSAKEQNAGWN